MSLLEPIQKALAQVIEIKDANRPNPGFNSLSTVAEGIPSLGWFTCVSSFVLILYYITKMSTCNRNPHLFLLFVI